MTKTTPDAEQLLRIETMILELEKRHSLVRTRKRRSAQTRVFVACWCTKSTACRMETDESRTTTAIVHLHARRIEHAPYQKQGEENEMTRLIAIDPGTTKSAYVMMDDSRDVVGGAIIDNAELELRLRIMQRGIGRADHLAIEMVASFGKPVGAEVFETCVWIGRFIGAFAEPYTLITRPQIKKHLCHSFFKVTDGAIRQRVIDLFGGKEVAVGKKSKPGPLYGMKGDCWQALAVGVVWFSMQEGVEAVA